MKTQTMTRREWIETAKTKLDEWDATLTELESTASGLREELGAEVRSRLTATRKAVDEARERWTETRNTASNLWDTVSEEMGTAWDLNLMAIDRSLGEIRSALKK